MSDRPLHFVDTPDALARVAALVRGAREIGVDAEMNGLHAFRARVCVLQIATDEVDVVVDTVKLRDLGPLKDALLAGGVTRYAHGAAHDVKCLKEDFGVGIEGLFDTYVASQLLGVEKLGYGDIVAARFGTPLDKALQTADWGRRPLTDKQIEYLRNDIRFLLSLGRQLRAELAEKDLVEEAEHEFGRVAALPADEDRVDEDAWRKLKEARELAPAQQAALRELFLARDAIARRMDRPPFKVAGERSLFDLAKARAETPDAVARIPGLPRHAPPRMYQELAEAVKRGLALGAPPPAQPGPPRLEGEEIRARRAREETLRAWRKKTAAARAVPPMVVLPSYALEDLVRQPARDLADLATRPGMIAKRVRLYGLELLALLEPRDAAQKSPDA